MYSGVSEAPFTVAAFCGKLVMLLYVCAYIYIHTHICVCACLCVYIYIYTHTRQGARILLALCS